MATLDLIRAAIVAKVAAVQNIGRVHAWQRYAADAAAMAALYRATVGGQPQLRGWYLSRVATQEASPARGRYVTVHTWTLRGYLGLDDAAQSEVVFDGLIEALREAFRTDETLGGLVDATVLDDGAGLQLDEQLPVMFAGVLCHSARLTLRTQVLA